jgi:hypothetical protein
MDTMILENFVTFLTRGRTKVFDSERRSYDQLKLGDLLRYDSFLVLTFVDCIASKVHLIHAHVYARSCHISVLSIPHQKKVCPIYKAYV